MGRLLRKLLVLHFSVPLCLLRSSQVWPSTQSQGTAQGIYPEYDSSHFLDAKFNNTQMYTKDIVKI